ncbi:hypothetical protein GCM10008967_19200 [Bacillus carboniphilus]|uniref:Zinc-finger domain-containing protein n=1 Tax=Bacillus carboniphilus TaxID=86663 RepID=A0ABP3FYC9_9BACI
MKHIPFEEWLKYVNGELAEDVQLDYENHLYSCETCIEVYSEAISHQSEALPTPLSSTFTDDVMTLIQGGEELQSVAHGVKMSKKKKERSFVQSTIFHYAAAAGFTLLLTFSGVFQSMTGFVDNFENTAQEQRPSVTETVMNKTLTLFDEWEIKNKEANQE